MSEDGRPPGKRAGSPLRASGLATPLVRLAGASAAPSRCWQAVMDAGRGPWAAEGPAASEASPDVSTSLRRRRGMTSLRRFRAAQGGAKRRPRSSCDVVPDCRVGLSSSWSLVRPQLWAASASAEREPDGGAAAHRALTRDPWLSARPSGSPPSTSATRRRRLIARRARCQLDPGPIRPAPRSLPGEWSRTQDQEDDRPTRQSGTTSQDERGRSLRSLPAPLRKRRDGAIPRLLRRLVLTPGLASLAAGADRPKGRRPHALARRTVRPPARHVVARRVGPARAAWPIDCSQRQADRLSSLAASPHPL